MRSKSPLALMEQVIMVLVFALAAALCLQVFAFSNQASRRNAAIDRAVTLCQTAAETLNAAGGDMAYAQEKAMAKLGGTVSQGMWYVCYDGDWNVVEDDGSSDVYRLMAHGRPASVDGLQLANIWAIEVDSGEELFSMSVAWQEVGGSNG